MFLWAQAIVGQGDALTVDDATYAGFELALLRDVTDMLSPGS